MVFVAGKVFLGDHLPILGWFAALSFPGLAAIPRLPNLAAGRAMGTTFFF